jgi:V/A-type H+-transporting ATPase subunit K
MKTQKFGKNWLFIAGALLPVALLALPSLMLWAPQLIASESVAVAAGTLTPEAIKWGFAAAATATGISAASAGYAVAHVGSAGIGALAEKPDLFGRVLVMVGLAEGIAIYGLIVSILILNRLG